MVDTKIHIRLSEELHQKLRIRCAIENLTMQEFVEKLIEDEVGAIEVDRVKQSVPKKKGKKS